MIRECSGVYGAREESCAQSAHEHALVLKSQRATAEGGCSPSPAPFALLGSPGMLLKQRGRPEARLRRRRAGARSGPRILGTFDPCASIDLYSTCLLYILRTRCTKSSACAGAQPTRAEGMVTDYANGLGGACRPVGMFHLASRANAAAPRDFPPFQIKSR